VTKQISRGKRRPRRLSVEAVPLTEGNVRQTRKVIFKKAVDSPQEEGRAACNKIESHRIMKTSDTTDIEFFCDVVSGILDRITKGGS
jgi:hypothetical protein